ncbi:MAG TPA: TolC family protein [Syntrophorhabdales bacterium]|nr:TolC family protein [Syntrophorhabdales bacterium]
MRKGLVVLLFVLPMGLSPFLSVSTAAESSLDLKSVIAYGKKHNPNLRIAQKSIESEQFGIDAAKSDILPKVNFGSGATRYRYPTPLTPIVIVPPITPNLELPDFERTIYNASASFTLPLYRGGRIVRNLRIAQTRKALAEDNYAASFQDLVYNLTSAYHKILQLQKLLESNQAQVEQLELHKRDVEAFLQAGTAPRLDLLKTDVELAHARDGVIAVKNNLEAAFSLLRELMGMDDESPPFSIAEQPLSPAAYPSDEEALDTALAKRPDFRAIARKKKIAEDQIRVAQGKWLPDISGAGQYIKRAGDSTSFKEDYYFGVNLTIPVFDGGLIRSEVNADKTELEKIKQEERAMRLSISRELKDARIAIDNASDRMEVARAAIESAREALRVEHLRYETGAGTTTDVIDAQTALLRAETDSFQAAYDREIGLASLKKGMGTLTDEQEVLK